MPLATLNVIVTVQKIALPYFFKSPQKGQYHSQLRALSCVWRAAVKGGPGRGPSLSCVVEDKLRVNRSLRLLSLEGLSPG